MLASSKAPNNMAGWKDGQGMPKRNRLKKGSKKHLNVMLKSRNTRYTTRPVQIMRWDIAHIDWLMQ